jgi:hypothetical protein
MTPIWATLLKYEGKTLRYGLSWITGWVFFLEKKFKPHFEHKEMPS